MWFKQNEPKSPAPGADFPAVKPQVQTVAPDVSAETFAPAPAPATSPGQAASARFSRGLMVKGEITGKEDLLIDGELEGTLKLEGARLTVGPAGRVRGEVFAREIIVQGQVSGNLHAVERIEVTPSGEVTGDVVTKWIAIGDGAVFNGTIEMSRPGRADAEPGKTSRAENRSETRAERAARNASAMSAHTPGASAAIDAPSLPAAGATQPERVETWTVASVPGSDSAN